MKAREEVLHTTRAHKNGAGGGGRRKQAHARTHTCTTDANVVVDTLA